MGKQNLESTVKKTKKEVAVWRVFLNNTIGVISFGFGLGCLGTPRPKFYALISFIFVFFLTVLGTKLFPATIKKLREKKDKFGPRVWITEYPAYFFGFTFLGCIAAGAIK